MFYESVREQVSHDKVFLVSVYKCGCVCVANCILTFNGATADVPQTFIGVTGSILIVTFYVFLYFSPVGDVKNRIRDSTFSKHDEFP